MGHMMGLVNMLMSYHDMTWYRAIFWVYFSSYHVMRFCHFSKNVMQFVTFHLFFSSDDKRQHKKLTSQSKKLSFWRTDYKRVPIATFQQPKNKTHIYFLFEIWHDKIVNMIEWLKLQLYHVVSCMIWHDILHDDQIVMSCCPTLQHAQKLE